MVESDTSCENCLKIAQVDKNWIYGILSITPERFFITAQDHLPANARAPLQSGPIIKHETYHIPVDCTINHNTNAQALH